MALAALLLWVLWTRVYPPLGARGIPCWARAFDVGLDVLAWWWR